MARGADINQRFVHPLDPLEREQTALHLFAYEGEIGLVLEAIRAGANAALRNDLDETVLHILASSSASLNAGQLREIIRAGARLSGFDHNGETPLTRAIMADRFTTAILFVEAGASKYLYNRTGKLPLSVARERRRLIEANLERARRGEHSPPFIDCQQALAFYMKQRDELSKLLSLIEL